MPEKGIAINTTYNITALRVKIQPLQVLTNTFRYTESKLKPPPTNAIYHNENSVREMTTLSYKG